MVDVARMPSCAATDSLRCESYTTPRVRSDDDDDPAKLKKELEQAADKVSGDAEVVRTRDGVRSAPPSALHFSAQIIESLNEKLVEASEQRSLYDTLVFESAIYDDWCEAASGWRQVVPYPKYITKQQPHSKSESSNKKSGGRVAIRCIDDDYGGELLCPSWKANVEPVTYRYIPNNGCYRNSKSNSKDAREWVVVKRTRSEQALVTPEARQAKKTLKRDLDSHFKGAGEVAAQQLPAQQPDNCHEANSAQVEIPQSRGFPYSAKCLPAKEQQLIKSASNLFMENFNSRLSALEKEIQTGCLPVQSKKLQETMPGVHHPALGVSKKLKDAKGPDMPKSTSLGMQEGGPNIGDDLFTVIPMCRPEVPLRPLEKLTPKQKLKEQSPSISVDGTPSPLEPQENETKIFLASATTQPQPTHRDSDSNQGINTARSAIAMTNMDIEKMRMRPFMERSVPLRTEFHTTKRAKSFLVQQGHAFGPTSHKGAMRYTTVSQPHQQNVDSQGSISTVGEEIVISDSLGVRPVGKTHVRETDSVGGGLPEIMGKRLTVTTTTHRHL